MHLIQSSSYFQNRVYSDTGHFECTMNRESPGTYPSIRCAPTLIRNKLVYIHQRQTFSVMSSYKHLKEAVEYNVQMHFTMIKFVLHLWSISNIKVSCWSFPEPMGHQVHLLRFLSFSEVYNQFNNGILLLSKKCRKEPTAWRLRVENAPKFEIKNC